MGRTTGVPRQVDMVLLIGMFSLRGCSRAVEDWRVASTNPLMECSAPMLFQVQLVSCRRVVVAERRNVRIHARICECDVAQNADRDCGDDLIHVSSPELRIKTCASVCVLFVPVENNPRLELRMNDVDTAALICEVFTLSGRARVKRGGTAF